MAATEEVDLKDGGRFMSLSEFELIEKAVCKLKISPEEDGTGFFVNLRYGEETKMGLMTNWHVCKDDKKDWKQVKAYFNYKYMEHPGDLVTLKPDLFHEKFQELDFRFCGIDNKCLNELKIKPIHYLHKYPTVVEGMNIKIFQHPEGDPKAFSDGKVLKVDRPYFRYNASTNPGSSGSPVFGSVPGEGCWYLVGIHHKGKKDEYNQGILMDEIISYLTNGQYTKPSKQKTGGLVTQQHCRELSSHLKDKDWRGMLRQSRHFNMEAEIDQLYKRLREQSYQTLVYLKDTDKLTMEGLKDLLKKVKRRDLSDKLEWCIELKVKNVSIRNHDEVEGWQNILQNLKEDIGTEWKWVLRYLDVDEQKIKNTDEQHTEIEEKAYNGLLRWAEETHKPTRIMLAYALTYAKKENLLQKLDTLQ